MNNNKGQGGKGTDNVDNCEGTFSQTFYCNKKEKPDTYYLPYGMKLGAIITLITALAIAAIWLIEKKKPFRQDASNTFLKVFEKVYFAGMSCAVAIVYVIPVIFTLYNNIVG